MYYSQRLTLVAIAAGCLGSCAKPPFLTRVSVLRFENLDNDAGADWIGRAISEEIAGQLEGTRHHAIVPFATLHRLDAAMGPRPVSAPGLSAELPAAIAAGADRLLTGYYRVNGNRLTITAVDENVGKRSETAPDIVTGTVDDLLHLTDTIAHHIDDEALPPITGSARALRSYAIGLETAGDAAIPLFQEAVQLDPDFGKPYVALAEMALAKRDTEEFSTIFASVRARGDGVRAVDRAELNLEDAQLHASLATRIDALAALARLMPADPVRLQELGNAELEANRYAEAADHYRKLQTLLPGNAEAPILLGYALMYSGDEAGARHTFENCRKSSPQDANAFDSSGDAEFFFGHFQEAEAFYLQAHAKYAGWNEGGDLLKAAGARLMRNDAAGATSLIGTYLQERGKVGDGLAAFRAAQVARVMGRHDEADRTIAEYAANGPAQVRQTAAAQLAWWKFLDGAQPAPENSSLNGQALTALAKKDYQAALPIWRKLAEEAPPTDWWTRTVYAHVLLATGQTQEGARYLRFTPTPQPSRGLSFDELWYPWILSARHQASGKVE